LFNEMKNGREFYRKYEAYIIGSEPNISVRFQFHFEGFCVCEIIVEVSNSYGVVKFISMNREIHDTLNIVEYSGCDFMSSTFYDKNK